ncbi:DUF58 domain-containing protein [Candidatus Riflebacteria bacterium]
MLNKELVAKIRKIQIQATRAVEDVLGGEYHSVFKGQGMEFEEVREYQRGDDIRHIDWNVTARMGKPFVKKFVEERELTVILLVDLSASGAFGSKNYLKNEVAAQLSALLSFAAIKNNDKVGLLIFTDKIEKYIPPKKGKKHVLRVIREILAFSVTSTQTNLNMALDFLNRVQKRKAVVFLLSDFLDKSWEKKIQVTSKRHDITAIRIIDQREEKFPDIGLVYLKDAETGEIKLIDSSSTFFRQNFGRLSNADRKGQNEFFKSRAIEHFEVDTGENFLDPVIKFFKKRESRR